jgi:beta-lactamase class D
MKAIPVLFLIAIFFSACSTNNVTVDDSLGRFFDSAGVKGCFALFDNGQGRFTVYNLPRYRDSAYPAGSTFDIPELLIGLQTGQLDDEKAILVVRDTLVVDTIHHTKTLSAPIPVTIKEGFQAAGGSWLFHKLSENIGMDTLKKWVDSLHYGNRVLEKDSFGVYNGSLKISADEQLGLIKKLYFNQLPFFKRPHEIVRGLMTKESNTNYQLVYKTANVPYQGHTLGWVMGWVEENKHPYFFVLNLEAADPHANAALIGTQIVEHILPSMGFFEGKK